MADCIRLLPEIISNQIKAGEVVEYPSSAIKEMMENAIDAGATKVTVNFVNGGRDLIQIIDNGCGMSPSDARMAFECHATSKIKELDDIYALHTFGFRGEALASIAAVAQVELTTRQSDAEIGTKVVMSGGEFISQTPVAAPIGSQFVVRNIFYNTPGRRKFIDEKHTQLPNMIKTEFRRVALCHPEVAMELLSDRSPIYSLQSSSLLERIIGIVGPSAKKNLLEVGVETSIAKIEGYVCRASAAKVRPDQYMFVNGRYFKSPYLNKAVAKAYEHLIPNGSQPSFFIYLTVDPERVDVNVHAQKIEVRFADTDAIWQIINAAVRETLAKTGSVPMMDFDAEDLIDIPVATTNISYQMPKATTCDNYNPFATEVTPSSGKPSKSTLYDVAQEFDSRTTSQDFELPNTSEFDYFDSEQAEQYMELESSVDNSISAVHYIGRRYASLMVGGVLAAIDLTRARERILYDRYLATLDGGKSASQQLLFPQSLTLSEAEYSLLEEWMVDFAALGFNITMRAGGVIDVSGIPSELNAESVDTTIYQLLQTLALPHEVETMRREQMALTLAQSGAAGRVQYSQAEAEAIAEQLIECKEHTYSPTGKTIMTFITLDDIQQKLS
ncbi:MAG: DNA mismatch repair endonuclease MutL [Rikenellaceae bacterium]|nr:DNA mismatch repair endonuclease MutL [Rikenellaceae bacterium]